MATTYRSSTVLRIFVLLVSNYIVIRMVMYRADSGACDQSIGERCWSAYTNFRRCFCRFWNPLPVFYCFHRVASSDWGLALTPFFLVLFAYYRWTLTIWFLRSAESWVLDLSNVACDRLNFQFSSSWWSWIGCYGESDQVCPYFVWSCDLACDWFLWRLKPGDFTILRHYKPIPYTSKR